MSFLSNKHRLFKKLFSVWLVAEWGFPHYDTPSACHCLKNIQKRIWMLLDAVKIIFLNLTYSSFFLFEKENKNINKGWVSVSPSHFWGGFCESSELECCCRHFSWCSGVFLLTFTNTHFHDGGLPSIQSKRSLFLRAARPQGVTKLLTWELPWVFCVLFRIF